MRRSISISEPTSCLAGEMLTWQFHHTPATTLPKGARLRFDLQSRGRNLDWQLPTTELKKAGDVIYLTLPDKQVIGAKRVDLQSGTVYDFILPKEIKATTPFTITMGGYKGTGKADPESDIGAQTYTQRRRTFLLYIDPKGKTQFDHPEEFHIDVLGNLLHVIRVLTPAFVTRGKRFDITIRFEDQFGNLTGMAPENTLIELTYEHLRENLNWKLFVPETGFITLPNLYFNEPGTYRIQLKNTLNNSVSYSAPIRCYAEECQQLEWGLLRGESEKVDTLHEPEAALRHFRDEACYNFFGASAISNDDALTPELWKNLSNQVSEFNEEDRFSALLGYQWLGANAKEGMRLVVYNKDNRPLGRSNDIKTNSIKKLHKSLPIKESLSIPFMTMSPDVGYNFQEWDPDFERVAEIYSAWGSHECLRQEDNAFPLSSAPGKVREFAQGSLRAALNSGKRFGFVAGGLDDRGIFEKFIDSKQVKYTPGLTAIIAKQHHRDSLFEALYQRRCYATTGERILLEFLVANQPMGSELSAIEKPGLAINRHLHGFVAGTSPLTHVEIIRNGEVWKTIKPAPNTMNLELALDDDDHPKSCTLHADDKLFTYYYLRVTQKDGHMAWSSPVWIDYDKAQLLPSGHSKPAVKPAKETKPVKEAKTSAKTPKAETPIKVVKPAKPAKSLQAPKAKGKSKN